MRQLFVSALICSRCSAFGCHHDDDADDDDDDGDAADGDDDNRDW